jgi:tRNA-dihydrouridine synthase
MIGRASIGNPWFFNEVKHYFETGLHKEPVSIKERAAVAKRHLEMSVAWKGEKLGVYETRRHYSNYFKGIENFKPYRQKLVTTETSNEVYEILDSISEKFAQYSF